MADSSSLAIRFEDIVRRVLTNSDFRIEPSSGNRFDFLGVRGGTTIAIEVKYYRSPTAQIRLVEAAAMQLSAAARSSTASSALLVISAVIPPEARDVLERRLQVSVLDRSALVELAMRAPVLLDELRSVLEGEVPLDVTSKPHRERSAVFALRPFAESSPPTPGADLCSQLRALVKGRPAWTAYETLCIEILKYLFGHDLYGWHKQLRTDDGFARYDCVCRMKSDGAFWRFLIEQLNSRYVLFEFKNYTRAIKQGQVLTTEKYLFARGLRRVAIMLTRNGADRGAKAMIQGAMREHGKLIVVLDDDAICELLTMRDNGEDATDFLFDRVDEFLLSLPR